MAAILQTSGPVTIHAVICRNYKFLSKSTADQFMEAAHELQSLNLGSVVAMGRSCVFIKRPPDEVMIILDANPDLCSRDFYRSRYNKPLSKSVPLGIRHQLSTKKLVPAKLMM